MRGAAYLAVLAVAGAGCLNQVAQLVDGGNDGGACGWRDASDAGICSNDSQCPGGSYCDFTVTECLSSWDGGTTPLISLINPGSCFPVCAGAPCMGDFDSNCGPCNIGEDCSTWEICYEGRTCTLQQPCSAGVCATTGQVPDEPCPSPCALVSVPHSTSAACVCPGNTCGVPGLPDAGGPVDAGPDAGVDSGVDAGMDSGVDAGVDSGVDAGSSCQSPPALGAAMSFNRPFANSWDLEVADFNHDGIDDLVQVQDAAVQIYFGLSDGGLALGPSFTYSRYAVRMTIADLNADGWPDLVIIDQNTMTLDLEVNQHDGSFEGYRLPITTSAALTEPWSVVVADLDGDGRPDIALCGYGMGIQLYFDDGGFPADAGGAPGFAPAVVLTLDSCWQIIAASLSQASVPDLISLPYSNEEVQVWTAIGDGGFLAPATYATTGLTDSVRAADLNGDGFPDVAVGTFQPGVSVFLNVGGGTLGPRASLIIRPERRALASQ